MKVPPEHELVLVCARRRLRSAELDRARELVGRPLDWQEVLHAALSHGLAPLLLPHLEALPAGVVPDPVLERLRTESVRIAARSLYLARELTEVLRLLVAEGIPAIPFKGPTLAVQAYGAVGLRSFGDLDLLVRPSAVSRVRKLLLARGYAAKYPQRLGFSAAQFDAFLAAEYNDEFVRGADGAKVEVHWHFAPRFFGFQLDVADLWGRTEQVLLNGEHVNALSREDLLLVLCVHGAEHAWVSLEGIVAVAELLRDEPGIDWAALIQRAERAHARRVLRLGLLLAADLLAAPIPDWVERELRDDRIAADLVRKVAVNLFSGEMDPRREEHRPRLLAFYLAVKDRWIDQARFCLRLLATPSERDWKMVRLPDAFHLLYWIIRPIRLLARLPRYRRWRTAG